MGDRLLARLFAIITGLSGLTALLILDLESESDLLTLIIGIPSALAIAYAVLSWFLKI